MKKSWIILFLIGMGWTGAISAQVYQPGAFYFSLGSSILHNNGFNMPIDFRAEYGVHKLVSAGVYFSYGLGIEKDAWIDTWTGSEVNIVRHYVTPGVFGSFHLGELGTFKEKMGDKMDLYVSGFVGAQFRIQRVPDDIFAFIPPNKRKFRVGSTLGVRYEVVTPLKVYLEAGWGPSGAVLFGLTYRLGVK